MVEGARRQASAELKSEVGWLSSGLATFAGVAREGLAGMVEEDDQADTNGVIFDLSKTVSR